MSITVVDRFSESTNKLFPTCLFKAASGWRRSNSHRKVISMLFYQIDYFKIKLSAVSDLLEVSWTMFCAANL